MPYSEFKVLVVDDIEKNLQIIGNILQNKGISISFAADGKQAIKATKIKKPDLILLDIAMPDMDGYEVCEILKNNVSTRDIPVIFLTAKDEIQDKIKGFAYGAVDYITKPFNKEELISRVFTHLELKKSHDTISAQTKKLEALNSKILEHSNIVEKLNNKLNSQNELLKKLNTTKDKFFSIISHDLRNPLNIISNFSELLLENIEAQKYDKIKMYGDMLNISAKNTIKLLNNLLDWALSQTGKKEHHPDFYLINAILKENVELLSEPARMKNITIEFNEEKKEEAYFDLDMINTVVRNLISNAVKYTNKDGKIKISSGKIKQNEKEFIEIKIADDGIGMEPKVLSRLFESGQTFSTKGTNGELGTGFGLILCKEFVKKNGGKINAESIKGKGSTFLFTIPLKPDYQDIKEQANFVN